MRDSTQTHNRDAVVDRALHDVVDPTPDHSEDSDCERCLDYRLAMAKAGMRTTSRLDEQEREASERLVWATDGDRRVAKAELGSATRDLEKVRRVRERVRTRRDQRLHRANQLGEQARLSGRLSDQGMKSEARAAERVGQLDVADRRLARMEQRLEKEAAKYRVIAEPRVYGPDSEHSRFLDCAARANEHGDAAQRNAALGRLAQYTRELAYEVEQGSKEGRRVLALLKEETRGVGGNLPDGPDVHERVFGEREAELRAFGTDGGASATAPGEASAFVSPFFLLDEWAPYHGAYRTFADQCHSEPMCPWGMHVYIPYFSTGAKATEQTEGGSVTETAPVAAFEGAEVKNVSGQVIVSQQLHERGFRGGGSFDGVVSRQLEQQLAERIDKYVIGQAIEKGASVSGAAPWAIEKLYEDLAKGREQITDTAGTRLRPTHMFTSSDFYSYVTRQVDTTNKRPLVIPEFAPGFPLAQHADDGPHSDQSHPAWARFTGSVMPGGVLWFTDDNIPTFGTTTQIQILVSAVDQSITLLEGPPVVSVFTETLGDTLRVVLNLRSYVAAITRHASGTASIAGAGYTSGLL